MPDLPHRSIAPRPTPHDRPNRLTRREVLTRGAGLAGAASLGLLGPGPACGQSGIGPEAEFVDPTPDDELLPINVRQNWGLINQSGRIIVLPTLRWSDIGYGGLARVLFGEFTQFIVGNGNLAFDARYPYADRFAEGYAIVGDGERFGYIDRRGTLFARPQFDDALRFHEGFAAVRLGNRCGYLDQRFKPVIPLKFREARSFFDGLAAVQVPVGEADDYRVAYLDKRGVAIFAETTGRINELGDFCEGYARFREGTKWGFLDKRFETVIPPRFDGARDFTNGSAAFRLGDKWGYIDRTGRITVQPIYDFADDFDDTLAMVGVDEKLGYIDRTGRVAVEPQFDLAEPFKFKLARVSVGDTFGYIQVSGRILWDPRSAENGIVNRTLGEKIDRARNRSYRIATQRFAPPPPRPVVDPPYPPDFVYDPVLRAPVPDEKRPL